MAKKLDSSYVEFEVGTKADLATHSKPIHVMIMLNLASL